MIKEIAPKTFALNGNKSLKDMPMNEATWFLMRQITELLDRITDISKEDCEKLAKSMIENADWDILFEKNWTVDPSRTIR